MCLWPACLNSCAACGTLDEFGYELWGCHVGLVFPSVKLLDYRSQWSSLERSHNPFAVVVMAHLKSQETRNNPTERQMWKLRLTRRLYQLGYNSGIPCAQCAQRADDRATGRGVGGRLGGGSGRGRGGIGGGRRRERGRRVAGVGLSAVLGTAVDLLSRKLSVVDQAGPSFLGSAFQCGSVF